MGNLSDLPTLPKYGEMEGAYGTDLESMFSDYNKLIGMILSEEEDLIECHKSHVNEIINIEKDEMALIAEVDKSGSDVERYINDLDKMLMQKMTMISALRKKLLVFNSHLQMEKNLQSLYQEKQGAASENMHTDPDAAYG